MLLRYLKDASFTEAEIKRLIELAEEIRKPTP